MRGRKDRAMTLPEWLAIVLDLDAYIAKGGRLGAQRLTDKSVCDLVKAYAERLGLNAADFGAHSLRAGFLTSAARRGASVFKMRDVSRHKSMDVLQAYVRDADMFQDHVGAGLL